MNYPVAIFREEGPDYVVRVPDLPGCFSAGQNPERAIANAREAILCHIEGMLFDGETIPLPSPIETFIQETEFSGCIWAVVHADLSEISGKSKKIKLLVPRPMLVSLGAYAEKHNESLAGVLLNAIVEFIANNCRK